MLYCRSRRSLEVWIRCCDNYGIYEPVDIIEKVSKTDVALDEYQKDSENLHLMTTMTLLLLTVIELLRQAYTN